MSNPPIAGFGGVAGTQGLTTQTLYDADLTDNTGLETTTGITVTNPLGGTYTVSLAAAITKLGQPIAQGGAGITFAAGTPGSAVVNINAEDEVSFSISDAQGRSLMSGILHPHDAVAPNTPGAMLTWSCQVPDTTETVNSKVYLTSLSVDALGNTTKSRSNGLGHTVQSVDQAGNISTVQYDASGNAIVSRDPNNVGQDCLYDALGRRTQCTDTVGSVTKTGYDKSGQQISATDAKNKTTYYVFDARGRRRRETDRLNYPTEWSYDAAGNLLSLKDAENQITSYGYNDAGQRVTEQYPDHVSGATIGQAGYGIITFGYDALGRRISKQDQQGDVTSYNFDMSGRMLTRGYVGHASGPLAGQTNTDTFTYDRAGRMLSGIKGRYNNTVTFSYDDRGQQTQETLTTHGQTYTVGYVKNVLGQTTRLVYPDGSLVDRAYTNRGQLQAVNYTPLGGASSSVAIFSYDAGGRETQRNLGNGLTTTRSYFADNQIQSIATPTVETLTYTYDANKNPTSETRSGVMTPYSWTTGPSGYDDEDRLTNWSSTKGDSQSWNLSPVHDWNSTTINGALQTRTHGPAHEILNITGAQVSSSPAVLQYDAKGNMTTDDRGCGMTWDFDSMLQSFNANGVTGLENATYEYDVFDRRISETANNSIRHWVSSGFTNCAVNDLALGSRNYLYGQFQSMLATARLGAYPLTFLLSNKSGETTAVLEGNAIETYSAYLPDGCPFLVDQAGVENHDSAALVVQDATEISSATGLRMTTTRLLRTSLGRTLSTSSVPRMRPNLVSGRMLNQNQRSVIQQADPQTEPPNVTIRRLCDVITKRDTDDKTKYDHDDSCCMGELMPDFRQDCRNRMNSVLDDPAIKALKNEIPERCRSKIDYRCECCKASPKAYWQPTGVDSGRLAVCWNNSRKKSQEELRDLVLHELTHALQTCTGMNSPDPNGTPSERCLDAYVMEIEAYKCGNSCTTVESCLGRALVSVCGTHCETKHLSDDELEKIRRWFAQREKDKDWCTNRMGK